MTIDPSAVAVTLMTQEVEHQQQQQQGVAALEAAEASNHEDVKPKGPGSTRRGKQYKCGNCHELGHNQYVLLFLFLFPFYSARRSQSGL